MPDKPFVINDRRKFTAEGELKPEFAHEETQREEPTPAAAPEPEASRGPQLVTEEPKPAANEPLAFPSPAGEQQADEADAADFGEGQLPPAPTAEQTEQANRAYAATVERLDTAVRAMDPGAEHAPPMTFDRLVQSLYMQALIQLGGAGDPNQPMRVDLMGARATIDMLAVMEEKTRGNLTENESKLIQSALFELRLGFLDITQALAKQAAQRPGGPNMPPPPGGPSLIR